MSSFRFDWIWVSFLCLFVISSSDHLGRQEFIDLSQFDYMVNDEFGAISITFVHNPDVKMQIKCVNCTKADSGAIKCYENDLVKVDIEMKEKSTLLSFPFNISCTRNGFGKNIFVVPYIDTRPGVTDIWMTWRQPSRNIHNHLMIINDKSGFYKWNILRETSYQVMNLKEKSWYQICIASIDRMWITSRFNCIKALTDFSTTGPLMNVTTIPESDRVFISWSRPEYEYDIPQGFIIYLQAITNQMCRLYIIKRQLDINPTRQYSCVNTETITSSLSSLEIKDLPPNSEFNIEISPFNRNKKPVIKYLTIKTKEGESGPVQNPSVDPDSDPHNIHISFDVPINPAGIILKYRLRVILKRINICTSSEDIIHEAYTDQLQNHISKAIVNKCGLYFLEVAPLNGWNRNGGVGKTTSVSFNYTMDHQSSWTVNTKFISSNSLTVSLESLKEDKCENFGLIIEMKDETNHSNCIKRIISSLDCEAFKKEIYKEKTCAVQLINQKLNLSRSYESFISGLALNVHSYVLAVYKITNIITYVISKSTGTAEITDCFTDCFNIGELYTGIRSDLNGTERCAKSKNAETLKYRNEQFNKCSANTSSPWCSHSNNRYYCAVPECSSISRGTGCVDVVHKNEKTRNMLIRWSEIPFMKVIGYLVMLYKSGQFCEQAEIQLCNNCGTTKMLESEIKSLYFSCQIKNGVSHINLEVNFSDLHQNHMYTIYIVPIITTSRNGEIRNVTVQTSLAKPHVPNGVRIHLYKTREIKLFWVTNVETKINGPPDYYVVHITNKNSGRTVSLRRYVEHITFKDLENCAEYCVILSSYNKAGESDYTKELCTFTLAPKPEKPELKVPPSGYMRYQTLSWSYLGSENCQKTFMVEYRVKFVSQYSLFTFTKDTSILLTDLRPNVIYEVKVRAEGQMKTVKNKSIGEFSTPIEFYTGRLQPNLSYYQQNFDRHNQTLDISWGIDEEMKGSIFMYVVQVKNYRHKCMFSVLLTCQVSTEPWSLNNAKDQLGEYLKKLTNCTVSLNGTMDADQTSFNYVFNSKRKFTTYSVDVYGINLMGIHLLNKKSTHTPTSGLPFSNFVALIIIPIVLSILLFIILTYVTPKGKHIRLVLQTNYMKRRSHVKISEEESENLSKKIMISAFPAYYQKVSKFRFTKLIKQFKKLKYESKNQEASLKLTKYVGKCSENSMKNLLVNVLPYDQNRVKIGHQEAPLDYINASFIPFKNYESEIEYIAAQGPIKGSLSDFWEMIWELEINCIVMLTKTVEVKEPKCLQYWSDDGEESVLYGNNNQFDVSLVFEEVRESYTERELGVENKKNNEFRKIKQLHMHTWPDHSAPNLYFFDQLLFRFHEIASNKEGSNPYLVHCSAGLGATGTFICIDRIIKQLVSGIQMISIYNMVLKLRQYRSFLVEKKVQYIFIHKYIDHFLEKYMKIEDDEGCDYDC